MIESWEWEEVAGHMLGLPEETDAEVIEAELYDKCGISLEVFADVAGRLLNMTAPIKTALTDQVVQAFVVTEEYGARAIVKQEYTK